MEGGGGVCCVYLQLDAFLTLVRRRGRKVLEVHRHTGGRDIAALTEPHAHEGIPVVIDDDVGVVPGVGGVSLLLGGWKEDRRERATYQGI